MFGILEPKCVEIFTSDDPEKLADKINEHFNKYPRARMVDIKYTISPRPHSDLTIYSALLIFTEQGE